MLGTWRSPSSGPWSCSSRPRGTCTSGRASSSASPGPALARRRGSRDALPHRARRPHRSLAPPRPRGRRARRPHARLSDPPAPGRPRRVARDGRRAAPSADDGPTPGQRPAAAAAATAAAAVDAVIAAAVRATAVATASGPTGRAGALRPRRGHRVPRQGRPERRERPARREQPDDRRRARVGRLAVLQHAPDPGPQTRLVLGVRRGPPRRAEEPEHGALLPADEAPRDEPLDHLAPQVGAERDEQRLHPLGLRRDRVERRLQERVGQRSVADRGDAWPVEDARAVDLHAPGAARAR